MQDFNRFGVITRDERQRLFQLIQRIKAEYPSLAKIAAQSRRSESNIQGM